MGKWREHDARYLDTIGSNVFLVQGVRSTYAAKSLRI